MINGFKIILMFSHVLLTFFWAPSLIGWGSLIYLFFIKDNLVKNNILNIGEIGLFGFVIIGIVSMFFNFFIPLNSTLSEIFWILGISFLIINYSILRKVTRNSDWCIFVFITLFYTVLSTFLYHIIDTGHYHLPTVTILHNSSLPLGLGNLFGPYAHSPTWFFIGAVFSLPIFKLESLFSMNSLLWAYFCTAFYLELKNAPYSTALISVFFLVSNYFFVGVGGITQDLSAQLYSIYSWFLLLKILEENHNDFFIATTFSLFAISCKLSVLPTLIFVVIVFFIKNGIKNYKKLILLFFKSSKGLFLLFFSFVYIVKNVMVSGCIIYPQKNTCFFSLPWSMPYQSLTYWSMDVRKYTFNGMPKTGFIFKDTSWFYPWLINLLKDHFMWITTSIILFGLFLYFYSKFKFKNQISSKVLLLSLVLHSIALTYWLLTAPNLRFFTSYLLTFSATILGLGISKMDLKINRKIRVILLIISAAVCLRTTMLSQPRLNLNDWPYIKTPKGKLLLEKDNLKIFTPKRGFCYNIEPFCTLYHSIEIKKTLFGKIMFISNIRNFINLEGHKH